MAAIKEVVYTATETNDMMDDAVLNPIHTEKRGEVHITLVFDGQAIDPPAIYDALDTLGVVQADKIPTRGNYSFIIS